MATTKLSKICGHNKIFSNRTDAAHFGSLIGKNKKKNVLKNGEEFARLGLAEGQGKN